MQHKTSNLDALPGDWMPFDPRDPNIAPGVYWAVGQRQDARIGMPGLHPFQILMEVSDKDGDLHFFPPGQTCWSTFNACLPFIEKVQPLYYPLNPITGTRTPKEYA